MEVNILKTPTDNSDTPLETDLGNTGLTDMNLTINGAAEGRSLQSQMQQSRREAAVRSVADGGIESSPPPRRHLCKAPGVL